MAMPTLEKLEKRQIKDIFKTYMEYKLWLNCESNEENSQPERKMYFVNLKNYVRTVENAVKKLETRENYIIQTRYFNENQKSDKDIYTALKISRSNYYLVKKSAFEKLSVLLYALKEGD